MINKKTSKIKENQRKAQKTGTQGNEEENCKKMENEGK